MEHFSFDRLHHWPTTIPGHRQRQQPWTPTKVSDMPRRRPRFLAEATEEAKTARSTAKNGNLWADCIVSPTHGEQPSAELQLKQQMYGFSTAQLEPLLVPEHFRSSRGDRSSTTTQIVALKKNRHLYTSNEPTCVICILAPGASCGVRVRLHTRLLRERHRPCLPPVPSGVLLPCWGNSHRMPAGNIHRIHPTASSNRPLSK